MAPRIRFMRNLAKHTLRFIFSMLAWPATAAFRVHAAVAGRDVAMTAWSELFSLVPGRSGIYLRHAFFFQNLSACGDDTCVCFGTVFCSGSVSLGRSVYLGRCCSVGDVQIEDDVLIASHVSLMNGCRQHSLDRLDVPVREQAGAFPRIVIGADTWIGERAIVAADVGKHCVIGAGALVLRPVPDYAIVVGVPGKIVGDRRDHAATIPVRGHRLESAAAAVTSGISAGEPRLN